MVNIFVGLKPKLVGDGFRS